MADEEAEQDSCGHSGSFFEIQALSARLEKLASVLNDSPDCSQDSSSQYCQAFCKTLVEYVGRWRSVDDPWPMLEGYAVALLSYARASTHLSTQCNDVSVVLERVSLSCVELLLSISATIPDALWVQFQSSVQAAHSLLEENGISQLCILTAASREKGMWTNSILRGILNNETLPVKTVHEFLRQEGAALLQERVKFLIKENYMDKAALLARVCTDCPGLEGRAGHFTQIYLVCLCTVAPQQTLMDELSRVDCRDALEMICNLEAEGDERGSFTLCSGFLSRQLLQEDSYCAWELTLFWSKLLKRLEPSQQGFLERCRQMSRLAKTVVHLLFFIKVIQSELDKFGLPACVEMCVRALRMESCEGASKATMCKTISCLLPSDLEVKRACQLTEFLLEPTVDSYYAVETLYNEPDQKPEEESLPIPNSLRCELLLVFKTQWPFDPEYWDWKTLKRHCLGLMGEEASIVSSIDELNDDHPEETEQADSGFVQETFKDVSEHFLDATNGLKEIADQKQKNREIKKLREKGFVSARFRNWQAYMQYCVLCDKEFLGHRIVRHAQTHFKDGLYSCPICAETFETRETLDPHVTSHVKLSCKERLAAMKTTKKLVSAKPTSPVPAAPRAKGGDGQGRRSKAKSSYSGDSDWLNNGDSGAPHLELPGGVESNVCPVPYCRKRFKYLRNLLAHVKDHGDVEEAQRFLDLQTTRIICQYCRRQFVSVSHLNDHLQVHCGTKPYICIQLNCKAAFDSNTELLVHKKDHLVFKAKCMFPGCGKIFSEAFKLYDHEAQHYQTFTCRVSGCGKVFHAQSQLDLHRESHDAKKTPEHAPEEPQPDEPSTEAFLQDSHSGVHLDSSGGASSGSSSHSPALVKVKHSVESMLNTADPSCKLAFDPGTLKTEPPDPNLIEPHIPHVESQTIPPTVNSSMTQLNEARPDDSLLAALMSDPVLAPPRSGPLTSSCLRNLDDFPPVPSSVSQGHIQTTVSQNHNPPLYSNTNREFGQYPKSGAQIQTRYQEPYGNSMSSSLLSAHSGTPLMAAAQRLPPPPRSTNGQVTVTRPVHPLHTVCSTSTSNDVNRPGVSAHSQSMHTANLTPDMNRPVPSIHTTSLTPDMNRPVPSIHTTSLTPDMNRPVQSIHTTSLTPDMNRPVQSIHTTSLTPAGEEKERHRCAYEACSRDYSSYRSLTKHMKAAHPEFYTQWKLARKNNREVQSMSRPAPTNGKINSVASLQKQVGQRIPAPVSEIQSPSIQPVCSTGTPCPSYSSVSSHLASTSGQTFPNQMENILDPIVLSQLGNPGSPSHRATERSWNSVPVNSSLQQQTCHTQGVTLNVDTRSVGQLSSHMNTGSQSQRPDVQCEGMVFPPAQSHNNPPHHFIPAQMEGTQRLSNPAVPSHSSDSAASPYTQQSKNVSVDVKRTECVVKLERNPNLGLPYPNSSQHKTPPTGGSSKGSQDNGGGSVHSGDIKRAKRNKRTKWPAIVRDGKFICCRCFREFQSPKSLGGHLSKRSHCKAFDDADLTADLPTSFLDLLNSPHPVNTPQNTASAHMNSNQSFHSVNKVPLDPKLFPNVTFLHGEDATYINNSIQSTEVIKQNSANPCQPFEAGQQNFTSTTVTYPQDGQNSRVQPSGHGHEESNEHQMKYTQSCSHLPSEGGGSDPSEGGGSDPLLSHLLGDENFSASFNKLPTDHIGKILQTETLNKMKEIKHQSAIVNTSGLSNDGLLAAMASLAQNLVSEKSVKEKLREQILAGDFHKKNSSCQEQVGDHSNLQSTGSSSSLIDPEQTSYGVQKVPQSDQYHVGQGVEGFTQPGSLVSDEGAAHIPVARDVNDDFTNQHLPQGDEITEIQKALERLDLDREIVQSNQLPTEPTESEGLAVVSEIVNSSVETPGYGCDSNGCGYRAMTKDALFKHLIKLHNYTDEMLNQWRKEQFKFAPFSCQICTKTFTRNSNLRAHYQTVHSYSHEQMVKTRIKRHYSRKSLEGDGNSPCPTTSISDLHILNEGMVQKAEGRHRQYIDGTSAPVMVSANGIQSEYNPPSFSQQPPYGSSNTRHPGTLQRAQLTPLRSQATVLPSVITSSCPSLEPASSTEPQLSSQLGPNPPVPSQYPHGVSPGGLLPPCTLVVPQTLHIPAQTGNLSPDKKPKLGRPKMPKPKEMTKKAKEKKVDMDDVFSPYRPYRCVHQGCMAAFTIQHNLILHYKAVHQSDLPKFDIDDEEEQNEEEENEDEHDISDGEVAEVSELWCQVQDCSRVFQAPPDLLQHYLQLHKLSLDKAGAMMSDMDLGRFQCDQPNCAVTFTAFWTYVDHIDKEHKDRKMLRAESVDGTFRCEVEGCDCVYSTRSNLLRHTMKKHQELYKEQLMNSKEREKAVKLGRPRKFSYACLEKENREVNKKPVCKGGEKKRKDEKNHWTKYGKPILKTTEEASTLCTKRFPLQYPCMIKGCETVCSSERNIMKHYVQHGLPKQYLEEQRSNYIYCKKLPRSRYKRIASRSDDTDKSDESSIEMSENDEAIDTGPSESEFSKLTSEKESTEDAEGSDGKPTTDTGSDVSVVLPRRRGRPRKGGCDPDRPFTQKRMTRLRAAQSYAINYADINSDSTSSSVAQEDGADQTASLNSFKPLGFEVSFLQFLEESSQPSVKRKASVMLDINPRKRTSAVHLKTASVVCSRFDAGDVPKLVEFKNPQKLTCLSNVTFEVHRGFSHVFELLLKQLHEMRPAVVIQKRGCI